MSGKRRIQTRLILLFSLSFNLVNCSAVPKQASFENPIKVSIPAKDGSMIDGYLFLPHNKGPHPSVVALHGCAGMFLKNGKMNPREMDWGTRLANEDYIVLYPDSFTTRGLNEICTRHDQPQMSRIIRPQDAFAVFEWLRLQDFVQADRIALMGWSNGGSSLLTAIDKNSKFLDLKSEADFKIAIGFYPGCDAAAADKNWGARIPFEILMGEADNWALPKPCQQVVSKSEKTIHAKITLYSESYHDFDSPNLPLTKIKNLSYVKRADHSAFIGANEESRQKAIIKVSELLKRYLKD